MGTTYCHLKRESRNPRRSNATDKTLCGRDDPGLFFYDTVEAGAKLPEGPEGYPHCPACVQEHAATVNEFAAVLLSVRPSPLRYRVLQRVRYWAGRLRWRLARGAEPPF